MEENKVKIGEKYKCIASPRYTCFKIGDTYEIKDEFEAELISLCRDCFTLDEESEDEKVRQELTTFLINFNNGYYSKPSEDKIDSWIKWIDKKCKQNHTDEVKPKFNVGDWVVNKLGHVWHIDSFDKKNYQVSNGDKYNYFPISKQDEMHLWTINDAEDGDVLYFSDETIVIFKDLYNATTFHSYCHIEYGLFVVKDDMPDWWEGKGFQPATKEQRDLLFQKMKENGYEWDAEKKELNKIEKQSEQIHAEWSEKDKENLNWVINVWNRLRRGGDAQTTPNQMEMLENWLKSLKDRVQPRPKKEWSKEDSERLLRIHQFIWANRKGDTDEIYQQEQDADWLMSLIPQQNQYDKGYEDGYSAAKYNQWKPTDKQMEDFRMLLDYNIGVFDYAKFMSADSLYEDLKKNLID